MPVCIDFDGELNKLNDFPPFPQFHTLLLDKDNKVLVIGNPVHSTEIRSLYFKQLSETYDTANEKDDKLITTSEVSPSRPIGNLEGRRQQETAFRGKEYG
mgnify:CR=1 FL=1